MHRFFRWRERLQAAKDEKEIRQLMAEYLEVLDPEAVKMLPQECHEVLKAGDIPACAVALLQAEMAYSGDEETRMFLHEAAHTFAAASLRLSRLRKEPIVPS
jgi:hypothetical protein